MGDFARVDQGQKTAASQFRVGQPEHELVIGMATDDNGGLYATGYSGDVMAEFTRLQWGTECDRLSARLGFSIEEVSNVAMEGMIMAMDDDAFGLTLLDEVAEDERLSLYSAVARVMFLLCQGQEITSRQAGKKMTRSALSAWRCLRNIEASGFVPLRMVRDGHHWYWKLEASRYLRI